MYRVKDRFKDRQIDRHKDKWVDIKINRQI